MPLLHGHPKRTPASDAAVTASDDALVAAAQGHPHAFAPLFARYWEPVLRFCISRLESGAEAEDAASQIFIDAFAALPRFRREGGSFRGWLFTLARHEVADRRREQARHPQLPLPEAADLPDPADSLEHTAVATDDAARLLALLEALPPRPREVVSLRLAGLNDREIAAVLGISGEAVRQAQSRAVAELRRRMDVVAHERRMTHA